METRRKAMLPAISASPVIVRSKVIAAYFSRSAAIFLEGIHSLIDAGNGALLLSGLRRSRRPPDDQHPFGHGVSQWLVLEILFRRTLSANEVAGAIDRIEKSVRTKFPKIRHINLEADALSAPVRNDGRFTAQYTAERTG
jgi:divalent metal cation (Fe/Co/Zn/Cd) transporter